MPFAASLVSMEARATMRRRHAGWLTQAARLLARAVERIPAFAEMTTPRWGIEGLSGRGIALSRVKG